MSYSIDMTTYPKAIKYPINHGYDDRNGVPSSVIVHSTEGKQGQTFFSAATFLYNAAKVSAHYLIGRSGEIVQFLDPVTYSAWHAGPAEAPFVNQRSIGIECLHAEGENWPIIQKNALA